MFKIFMGKTERTKIQGITPKTVKDREENKLYQFKDKKKKKKEGVGETEINFKNMK